ncbi:hypothetical protein RN2511_047920 [Rhodococcus sp. NKCM2511]|uniref:hypothetical protein n=1 Tax=Rhodococcus sp. NKCM2511 TaxID=2766011 RepID=UPI00191107E8|nr:hypothetical protein [Rhodococcus sp. NKCM2511]GHP20056.1 hypothetical protein RN2511_047920 [Rhodococcus sp. NKCM2511]
MLTTLSDPVHSTAVDAFLSCTLAMRNAVLIDRVSASDKEFHFQNWVGDRLTEAGLAHDSIGRNSYPDYTLVHHPEGYEVKGLQWPGRESNYDSNSRVPTGEHNGRQVFYVFGRYPAGTSEREYPVVDLVICHGDFLNADHTYVHKNKNFRGFGSYGDLMVRDRKMYVAPTPFALAEGTTGQATLIVPAGFASDSRLEQVGHLVRTETEKVVTGYTFDLRANTLTPETMPNPSAGKQHVFVAYRRNGMGSGEVRMRDLPASDAVAVETESE